MSLIQSGGAGQFCLRGIARDEHLGADMLGGGNVDKIPSAGTGKPEDVTAYWLIRPSGLA